MHTAKRILITGATGFIGGHLLTEALALGLEVTVGVRPATSAEARQRLGVPTLELDYLDPEQMRQAIARLPHPEGEPPFHYIIHNAGATLAPSLEQFMLANTLPTSNLLDVLEAQAVLPERFVLMSSLSVYDAKGSADGVIRSGDTPLPQSDYAMSKYLAGQRLKESPIPHATLYPTGVYGPGDKDYLKALKSVQGGINAMCGMRAQRLTFVYAQDVARAALFLLTAQGAEGGDYLLSDGDEYTDAEYGRLMQELLGGGRCLHLRLPLWVLYLVCALGSVAGLLMGRTLLFNLDKYKILSARSWLCDPSPLFALGFRPRTDLRTGLAHTIAWARQRGLLR